MALVKKSVNRFKQYHNYLKENNQIEFKDTIKHICEVLGCNENSYYRKLSNPETLSIADKQAIATIYRLPVHFIFPEMEGNEFFAKN